MWGSKGLCSEDLSNQCKTQHSRYSLHSCRYRIFILVIPFAIIRLYVCLSVCLFVCLFAFPRIITMYGCRELFVIFMRCLCDDGDDVGSRPGITYVF